MVVTRQDNKTKLPGTSVIYMTDVSNVEVDDTCGMRYWYRKYEAGDGIINKDTIIGKLIDDQTHADLRTLSTMVDISVPAIQDVVDDALGALTATDKGDAKKMELLYRRLGWFVSFALFQEPAVREKWDTLPCESAIILDKDPLWVVAYPDRLMKHKKTGEITYREYVGMAPGLTREKWLQSWHYNIRLHVGLAAACDETVQPDPTLRPAYAQVMGMSKGHYSTLDNRLIHPYVWGYKDVHTGEWTSTMTERKAGHWIPAPVWDYPGGIVAWVRMLGESVARSQFQMSPAVYLNKDILDAWAGARIHREREIESIRGVSTSNPYMRSIYFRRVTNQCRPAEGDACQFHSACWDKKIGLAPLKTGAYVPNNPSLMGDLTA